MALRGIVEEVGHQLKVASRRDLLMTSVAMIGLGALLIVGGWWFVIGGTLAVEYVMEEPSRLTTRTGNSVGGMGLYYGLIGCALVLPGVFFACCGLVLGVGGLRRHRKL